MSSAAEDTPASLLKLLVTGSKAFDKRLNEHLRAAGHDVRPAHYAVFRNLPCEGARVSELAAGAGMTSQSMGELVSDLERAGYVERRADPHDGRARVVVPTETGRDALDTAAASISDIENLLGQHLGGDRVRELTTLLTELNHVLGDDEQAG